MMEFEIAVCAVSWAWLGVWTAERLGWGGPGAIVGAVVGAMVGALSSAWARSGAKR